MDKSIVALYLIFTIILTMGALNVNTAESGTINYSLYQKPYFTIEFTAQRMGVNIRLNDIPVYDVDNSGFMTLELPANEYMINGKNELTVITYPLFDDEDEQTNEYIDGSTLNVGLYVREDEDNSNTRKLISRVEITPGNAYTIGEHEVAKYTNQSTGTPISVTKDASVLDYPGYGVYKKQVATTWHIDNIETKLPRWQWQDGDIIKNDESHYNTLLHAYEALHKALSDKDLNLVKSISSNRSKELATAYYLGSEDAGFEYSALGKDMYSDTASLYEQLYLDYTKFEIIGNGKLARIFSGAHFQPILYGNYDTGQIYKYQFMWYLKNGKWILIR